MLRDQIKSCQTAIDIVSLIPKMKRCKSPKTFQLYYDKAKEIVFYNTSEIDYEIFKSNFIDYPKVDPERDSDFASFILRQRIIASDTFYRLLMLERYIDRSTDLSLIFFYEDTLKLF